MYSETCGATCSCARGRTDVAMMESIGTGANDTNETTLELFEICHLSQNDYPRYLRMFNFSEGGLANPTLWKLREQTLVSEAMAFFYILFFLIAFFWNFFILIMMCVRRKIFKEAAHVFLANLVLLDFLVAVFVMSFPIITSIQGEWILGVDDRARCYTCNVTGFFVTFLVDMSVHVLAVLSVDRVLHLAWPLKYKAYMTRVKATIIVVAIWVFVLVLNVLPFFGVGIIEFNRNLGVCLVRWSMNTIASFIYVGVLLLELLIPLLTLLLANTLTFQLISRVLKRTNERRKTLQRASTRRHHDMKEKEMQRAVVTEDERQYAKQQRQLRKYFTAVFISNIICWTMLFVVFLLFFALDASLFPPALFAVGFFCYLLTAIIHPMLETYFIQDLRIFFRKVRKGVRKELTRQTSSIVEKASYRLKPRDSQLNVISEVEAPSAVRVDLSLSLVEVGDEPSPTIGRENAVFEQIPEEDEEGEGQLLQGNRARESTSNESGVFSECPEQEPTQHHDTRSNTAS